MKIKTIIIIVCLAFTGYLANGQEVDSLLLNLKTAKEDSNKVLLLHKLSASQIYKNPELGLNYSSEALLLSQRIGYKKGEANSNYYIAVFLNTYGKLDESEIYFRKAGEIYREINNIWGETSVLGQIGGIYFDREKYDIALRLRFVALKLDRENRLRQNESSDLQNIAIILSRMTRYEDAESYFKEALIIKKEVGDWSGESMVYVNYGAMLIDQEKWTEALPCFEKALEIQEKLGEYRIIAACKTNLGNIYMRIKKYDSALKFQQDALDMYAFLKDTVGMANAYNGLGALYNETGNYRNGAKSYETAVKLLGNREDDTPLRTSFYGLHEAYKKRGNYKEALFYHEKSLQALSETYTEDLGNRVAELKELYEAEKRDQDILLLEEKNKAASASADKRKLWSLIIGVFGGFLLIILILIVIILVLRSNHQKKIKEIEIVKTKAELEQKVLRAQMNPHFIFNSLNSVQHYILSNQTQYAYDYLARFSTLIRQVLVNSEQSAIYLQKEIELLEIYIELEQRRFQNRFSYEIIYDKRLLLDQIEVPVMLIQPFVENAIWHGIMNMDKDKKGQLKVSFAFEQDVLKITVEDNGIGRKAAEKLKKNNEYDSVGMLFSQKRLEMMKLVSGKNSKIMVTDLYNEDGSAKGTKVDIILPV
jgi:tetratricopeptide (TPR) repeat protein